MEVDHVLRVKTEFMTQWDGLLTGKSVLSASGGTQFFFNNGNAGLKSEF